MNSTRLPRVTTALVLAVCLTAVVLVGARPAIGDVRDLSDHSGSWSWPLPSPHDVVVGFEAPEQVWSPGHRGIDIASAPAGVVTAPDDGVVHFAGTVVDRGVVSLEHDVAGPEVVLSSFEPVTSLVVEGEPVVKGQPIGTVDEGHCLVETCLHLGARIDGVYVSPLLLLGELHWSVLLPTRMP